MVKIEKWGYNADPQPSAALNSGVAADSTLSGYADPYVFDPTGYQIGLQEGWTTKDVAPGKYEIFDQAGSSLGFGYKSPTETLADYQRKHILESGKVASGIDYIKSLSTQNEQGQWINPKITDTVHRQAIYGWQWDNLLDGKIEYVPRAYASQEELDAAIAAQFANEQVTWTSPYLLDRKEQIPAYAPEDYAYQGTFGGIHAQYDPKVYASKEAMDADLQRLLDSSVKPDQLLAQGIAPDLAAWEMLGNILAGREEQKPLDTSLRDRTAEIMEMMGLDDDPYGLRKAEREQEKRAQEFQVAPVVQMGDIYTRNNHAFWTRGGQLYEPGKSNHWWGAREAFGLPATFYGNLPTTTRTEEITGENTLFGSKPVFKDGKLVGYQIDPTVLEREEVEKLNAMGDGHRFIINASENGASYQWNRTSSATANSIGREYNIGWGEVAKQVKDSDNLFVSADKIADIPGWKNRGQLSYENWSGGGWLSDNFGSILGAVLSFIPGMQWAGAVLSAGSAIANNNPVGAVLSLAGGAYNVGAMGEVAKGSTMGSTLASKVIGGSSTDLANKIIGGAATGALSGAATGGGDGAWRGAISGAMGPAIGAGVDSLNPGGAGGLLNGAASYGLSMAGNLALRPDSPSAALNTVAQNAPAQQGTAGSSGKGSASRTPVRIEKWGY